MTPWAWEAAEEVLPVSPERSVERAEREGAERAEIRSRGEAQRRRDAQSGTTVNQRAWVAGQRPATRTARALESQVGDNQKHL